MCKRQVNFLVLVSIKFLKSDHVKFLFRHRLKKMNSKVKEDAWVLIQKDGKSQNVQQGMMFIGREECDITLLASSCDKRHAVVFYDHKKVEIHIKDLNSRTGTYVNGLRIPEQTYVKLKPLDSIRFGYGPDIFTLQNCKTNIQPSQPIKPPDKPSRQTTPEKHGVVSENRLSSQKSIECTMEPSKSLEDSLEDLNETNEIKSLDAEEWRKKSVSPAFNSLTFKRSNTRVINSVNSSASTSPYVVQEEKDQSFSSETTPEQSPASKDKSSPVISRTSLAPKEATNENKDSPEEPGPLTMAFTVAFDNPMPKKKFSIRDSISKYAPRKAEVEHSARQKVDKNAEPVIKKSIGPDVSRPSQLELRKKKSPSEKSNNSNNSWMLNGQERSPVSEPKLSNGATYLIQKMFRSNSSDNTTFEPVVSPGRTGLYNPELSNNSKSPSAAKENGDKPSVCNDDAKSDTGTYTVDDDVNDKAVVEARKKIDEVFGVDKLNVQLREKAPKENSREIGNAVSPSKEEAWTTTRKDLPIIPPVRTKRRLPTPPVHQPNDASSSEALSHSMYDNYSEKTRPQTLNYSTFPKETRRDNSMVDQKSPMIDQMSFSVPNRRLTANNVELLQSSCAGKTSPVINGHDISPQRTSPFGSHWRRSPWHLSGSDMDLDHMRAETSSVLSDVSASTEPPSMTNHPSSKGDSGPQMKFNRAFALRRARLGLETELPPPSKSLVLRDSKPPMKESTSSNTLSPFSRQDGGRYSLRLPRNSSKATPAKTVTKTTVNRAPSASVQRLGHRRMESDPTKTGVLKKGPDQRISPQESKTKPATPRAAFQRAASFTDNPESVSDSDIRQGYSWKNADRQSISAMRSIPRLSQVSGRRDEDEQFLKESRASPKLIDRNELSALDNLVIQATSQLSSKLKTAAYRLLVKERDKFTEDSNERLMIDEVLPRVSETEGSTCSNCSERGVSQDLASILKNLKRVEQSLKVLTIVVDEERLDHRRMHCHNNEADDNLYVVDV